jgi:hypothetical protein
MAKRNRRKRQIMIHRPLHTTHKIEPHEPKQKPGLNSDPVEG